MCSTPHLERNAAVARVLEEETTVDLAFVEGRLLEASVGDIRGTSGLLEHAHVVLAATSEVNVERAGNLLEGGLACAVEDGDLARRKLVS